jgi:hypothetical protein
MATPFW